MTPAALRSALATIGWSQRAIAALEAGAAALDQAADRSHSYGYPEIAASRAELAASYRALAEKFRASDQ